MFRKTPPLSLFFFILAVCFPMAAQALVPQTAPVAQPVTQPAEGALTATITGVEGLAQVREGEDQKWQPAKVGMVVGQGAEFRTGPRSAIQFQIPPDQIVTLDRLGVVTLIDAISSAGSIKTDLGMKYGRVRYDIENAGLQHDSTIHSPGSTLAVTGTRVSLFNQGFYPVQAVSLTGRARFKDTTGRTTTLGGPGSSPISSTSGSGGPAGTALQQTYIDPTSSFSHSPSEQHAIIVTPLLAGFSFGQSLSGQGSSARPQTSSPSTPSFPTQNLGGLVFQLVWVASNPSSETTPDLDLIVHSPLGEILSPKTGQSISPSGGHAPVDDKGGSTLRAGHEFAFWPTSFPTGNYQLQVQHVFGSAAEFELFTLRNGHLAATPTVETINPKGGAVNVTVNIPATSSSAQPTVPTRSARSAGRR